MPAALTLRDVIDRLHRAAETTEYDWFEPQLPPVHHGVLPFAESLKDERRIDIWISVEDGPVCVRVLCGRIMGRYRLTSDGDYCEAWVWLHS